MEHREKMGNTAFAEAILGAALQKTEEKTSKPTETPTPAPEVLPDLAKIEVAVVVIPQYDGEKAKEEAAEKKQYAEAAGAKLTQVRENLEKIRDQIRRIDRDPNSALSGSAKSILAQLRVAEASEMAKEKQILGIKDEAVKSHVEFAALLDEIHGSDPSHIGEVREILSRVCKLGRYRFATETEIEKGRKDGWPQDAIFFEGKIYFANGERTDGRRALAAELRKLVDSAKTSKAAAMRESGDANLHDLEIGRPGLYYLYRPKRTEKAHVSEGGIEIPERKFYEGHALVELRDLNKGKFYVEAGKKVFKRPYVVIEVRDAIGSLSWMAGEGRRSVPHFWVKDNRIILPKNRDTGEPKRLEEEDFKRALRMIGALRALYAVWHRGLNPQAEKPKDEKPEGPIETPSVPSVDDSPPMPAEFDRKIGETEVFKKVEDVPTTLAAPSEKKTKKAKKA